MRFPGRRTQKALYNKKKPFNAFCDAEPCRKMNPVVFTMTTRKNRKRR
jgi:hypothetical protein